VPRADRHFAGTLDDDRIIGNARCGVGWLQVARRARRGCRESAESAAPMRRIATPTAARAAAPAAECGDESTARRRRNAGVRPETGSLLPAAPPFAKCEWKHVDFDALSCTIWHARC